METRDKSHLSVLVADDHWLARQALTHVLDELADKVRIVEAENTSELLQRTRDDGPFDLIVLDLNMPGDTPVGRLRALRDVAPNSPICVVSVSEARTDVLTCLQEGAVGYIPKSAGADEIFSTLARVIAGDVALPQRLLLFDGASSSERPDLAAIIRTRDIDELTPRQREVFDLLSDGCSNAEIAEKLNLSTNTIRVHIQAISQRLSVRSRTEVAMIAAQYRAELAP